MGHLSKLGWGCTLREPARSCQELEETKSKVRNVPRASGPAACTVPRGWGCQGRGSVGRENRGFWSLRFGQVGREIPGQEGWAALVSVPGARDGKSQSLPGRLDQHQHAQDLGLWTLWSSSEGV